MAEIGHIWTRSGHKKSRKLQENRVCEIKPLAPLRAQFLYAVQQRAPRGGEAFVIGRNVEQAPARVSATTSFRKTRAGGCSPVVNSFAAGSWNLRYHGKRRGERFWSMIQAVE